MRGSGLTEEELLAAVDDVVRSERMALAIPRDVRERVPWATKREFDEVALRLEREGKLTLHYHDFPSSLTPERRDSLVTDGRRYYAGMARRRQQANARHSPNATRRVFGGDLFPSNYFVVVGEPRGEAFTMAEFIRENEGAPPSERDLSAMRNLRIGEEVSLYGGTGAETRIRRVGFEERNRRHYEVLNLTRKLAEVNRRMNEEIDDLKRRGLPRSEYRAVFSEIMDRYDAEKDGLRPNGGGQPNAAAGRRARRFKIEGIEPIREGTNKIFVDIGRGQRLRVIVYPNGTMSILSDDGVSWLQSDLSAAEQARVRHAVSGGAHEPNASYYVWVLGTGDEPLDEGPHGPKDLESAKTYARIAATEGVHDRAVSRGLDPGASSFEIVRRYRAGTGERIV